MKTCAVIPAYNEQKTISKVIWEIKKYVDTVFVVDDGSTDNTAEIARQSGARVVRHNINRGIGFALQSGYNAAISNGFEYVVQLDSDGQHKPKYIPKMLDLVSDCDLVIGSRFLSRGYRQYPLVRRIGISFFTIVVNLLGGLKISDVTSGYRMFRTQALKKLIPLSSRHWAVGQTLNAGRKGLRIREISMEMSPRTIGRSQFSFYVYVLYPLKIFWTILKVMLSR